MQLCRPISSRSLTPRAASTVPTDFGALSEEEEDDLEDYGGIRKSSGGYTPFEFIEFTEVILKHEVGIQVKSPVSHCYTVWHNRLNWLQWFDFIDEMGFHEEDRSMVSIFLWYRWAATPFLELFVTMQRTHEKENKYILEEPVEGTPLMVGVLFQDDGDSPASTLVTLRVAYQLPKVLYEFAGKLAVYADVEEKLQHSMLEMKSFVERLGEQEALQISEEDEANIANNFKVQRKLVQEKKSRVEEEKKRRKQERVEAARQAEIAAAAIIIEKGPSDLSTIDAIADMVGYELDDAEPPQPLSSIDEEEGVAAAADNEPLKRRRGRPKGSTTKTSGMPTTKDLKNLGKASIDYNKYK